MSLKFQILVIVSICSGTISLKAQYFKRKLATEHFNNMAYFEAYPYYKDLAKKENARSSDLLNAGLCAYQLNDYISAENYLKQFQLKYANQFTFSEALVLFQTLKLNGKYNEVKTFLPTLDKLKNTCHITANYRKHENYLNAIKKDSAAYKIVNLESINTLYSEFSPYYNAKTNQLLFSSNRRNTFSSSNMFMWDHSYFLDIYTSSKKDSTHFSNTNTFKGHVKTNYHDGPILFSKDGRKVYVTRTNLKSERNNGDLTSIKRFDIIVFSVDESGKWDNGVKFPYCSNKYSVGNPALSADGNRIYFSSDMPGGYGESDLWYCDFKNGLWQKPVNLGPNINTEGRETFPYIFENDILFFSSDGRPGLGGLDIYYCSPTLDTHFEPQALSYPINTCADDFGFFLNNNYKTGYFSSNRTGGIGKDDIYYFSATKKIIEMKLQQKGVVYDNTTKLPIQNAKIYLMNTKGEVIDTATTSENGEYQISVPYNLTDFKIKATEQIKHYDNIVYIGEIILESDKFKIGESNLDVYLLPKYRLLCNIATQKDNTPIQNAIVTIEYTIKNQKKRDSLVTDRYGNVYELLKNGKLKDKISLAFEIKKEGYKPKMLNESIILDTSLVVKYYYKLSAQRQVTLNLEVVNEKGELIDADIDIVNNATNEKVFNSRKKSKRDVELRSGENYGLSVAADGFLFQSENLDIPEDSDYAKPKRIVLKRLTKGSNIVLNNVFFDLNKSTLRKASVNELEKLYLVLKENSTMKIELSGHTDNLGSASYNTKLSQNRAKAVVDYLISKGINSSRLVARGYGFSKPIASNDTEEGRQLNRRTELKILEIN